MMVEIQRGGNLLNLPVSHDDNPIGHRHGFCLVVRHINHRAGQLAVKSGDLGPRLDPHLRIQIG